MALRQHLLRLSLLCGLSIVIQAWMVLHAVVPAQDSIRYLAAAQAMARDGWWATITHTTDPPLFPTLVVGTSGCLANSWWTLAPQRLTWLRGLQLTAAAAVVASLIPLYALLLRWAGERVAVFGCVLFGVLGSTARLGADGLGEGVQLLAVTTAYYGLACFLTRDTESVRQDESRARRLWPPALLIATGMAIGVGMLGGSIVVALFPALLLVLLADDGRIGRLFARGGGARRCGAVAAGAAAVVIPYLALSAGWSTGALAVRLQANHDPETAALLNFTAEATTNFTPHDPTAVGRLVRWRLPDGTPAVFGHKESSTSSRSRGIVSAVGQFTRELAMLIGLPVAVLVLYGLARGRHLARGRIDRCFGRLALVYTLIAIAHCARVGYLSERHLLPLVPIALCWGGRGAVNLGQELAGLLPWSAQWADAWPRVPAATWFARAALTGTALVCAFQLIRPLHHSRWGHRQAAEWLATRGTAAGAVLDTRGWTALYSGRPTYRHEAAPLALASARLEYVVVEQRELELDSPRSKTLRELLSRSARQIMRFAPDGAEPGLGVCVYRWDPRRFAALDGEGKVRK